MYLWAQYGIIESNSRSTGGLENSRKNGSLSMELDDNQRRAIEAFYKEMYHLLSAYAYSALDDRSLAGEAVQDTFRIACAKADGFLSSPNPRGWLLNTLKNVIRNTIRTRAGLSRIVVASLDADESIYTAHEDTHDIDLVYSDLVGDGDYELLKRIALDRYSMSEAARELGISVEACKKRVQRAREKLKKRLEEKK
jgi:RNA polymerase sigma-70 factor (ECF subfamily)